jgi:hypothetical protein
MLRRLLNHTALKTVVLHLHYVGLHEGDIAGAFVTIQNALAELMTG